MRIVGIDPGSVSAAYAIIGDNPGTGRYFIEAVGDVPVADRMVDAAGFARVLKRYRPDLAVIEKVGAMPKQGVSSTFKFGMGCGLLRGVIAACDVAIVEISPTVWKRHFRLDNDGEKSRSLALRRFPDAAADLQRKKDHGRAEALLIALWRFETAKVVEDVI